ncbi:hypothetical protein B0T24DRAFT_612649 [Lasiosphaeria ovina]|uniref:Uncharacterized protein n=1 Tax=Lasiosphaeria ovina TaxID=92902 RepID=A0AAE0NDY4_9PEZI|nr:hypothetical protein B0T24DRAFT_612649 [Lasiosphaeria ovina]
MCDVLNKTTRTYTAVENRVVELFESLEKLVDHEAQADAAAEGFNANPLRLRSRLQGWDFRDVATGRGPLYRRVTTPSSGPTWVDLTKSTGAVTLFGRGFGELIRPAATLLNPQTVRPLYRRHGRRCQRGEDSSAPACLTFETLPAARATSRRTRSPSRRGYCGTTHPGIISLAAGTVVGPRKRGIRSRSC